MSAAKILKIYLDRKKAGSSYSLRALARDTGVSAAFLSNVLSGKKKLPIGHAEKIIKILDIDSDSAFELKAALSSPSAQPSIARVKADWDNRPKSEFSLLRHWYYVAIMELTSCTTFDGTEETIASRLGIGLASAEIAVRELISIGALVRREGRLKKSVRFMRLASSSSRKEIRSFHKQMLDRAKAELSKTGDEDFASRLITGITVTASPEKIELAKKILSESLHQVAELLTDGDGTEVYHLSAQLFPITNRR